MVSRLKKVKSIGIVSRPRLILVGVVMSLIPLALVSRAYELQIAESDFYTQKARARYMRTMPINAYRGRILDRNGEPMAVSTPMVSIWADPHYAKLSDEQWRSLASVLGESAEALRNKVAQNETRRFVYLSRLETPLVGQEIKALRLKGIGINREYKRYYPNGEVSAHIVGFTDRDDKGQEGVELLFNDVLSQERGKSVVLRDGSGNTFAEVDRLSSPRDGQDVTLSIDRRLQYIAYRELKQAIEKQGAKSGSVVVLDVNTGEVLAAANQPSYNPNDPSQRSGAKIRNRAFVDLFEPGSTIKPLTISAALEGGQYTNQDIVDTSPGFLNVGGFKIKDARNYGWLTLGRILKKSSNVGMSKIALSLDVDELWATFDRFGVGQPTPIFFPGEPDGVLKHSASWSKADQVATSYGYGLSVTVLQLARAYAAIANGGDFLDVSIIKKQDEPLTQQILSPAVAKEVSRMLESVVEPGGTGERARVNGYRVAGKTGTAILSNRGGYEGERYRAMFAGFAPASNPQVAIIVMLSDPSNGQYYGGQIAAPVFSNVMAGTLRTLNILPDDVALQVAGTRGDSE